MILYNEYEVKFKQINPSQNYLNSKRTNTADFAWHVSTTGIWYKFKMFVSNICGFYSITVKILLKSPFICVY